MNLLGIYIKKYNDFQVIVLEYVSSKAWEGKEKEQLVEEFDSVQNALILP
ncbi:hypothetical protein HZF24_12490 [Sedimentibacter hydroxybenzoicus DSM 7310]|uniref:Uncharacterized protein n=1 Tax=Sedimentibacter hydroxybenzoicus DSM 7310 TaxID=1123245 RepID=A0A974BKR0_SEDHY|nr:hypothetical protein [Sedimentibacter hydroxybenzoicus]NYB74958.1 hypothetical protein [Sedimentibacter hydroxybenzoicus DSM 7310]